MASSSRMNRQISEDHKFRFFYLEMDPDSILPHLPSIFYRKFKDSLSTIMVFRDSHGNEVEMKLDFGIRLGYIVDGYSQLINFYNLYYGGWLKVFYAGGNVFYFRVRDINMQRVPYPYPPKKLSLDDPFVVDFFNQPFFDALPRPIVNLHLQHAPPNGDNGFPNQNDAVHTMPGSSNIFGQLHFSQDVLNNVLDPFVQHLPVSNPIVAPLADRDTALIVDSIISSVSESSLAPINDHLLAPSVPKTILDSNEHLVVLQHEELNNAPLEVAFDEELADPLNVNGNGAENIDVVEPIFVDADIDAHNHADVVQVGDGSVKFFMCEKVISDNEARSSALILPTAFVDQAFPNRVNILKLVDVHGNHYPLVLRWSLKRPREVYFGKGWHKFVIDHDVVSGSLIRLKVPVENENVVFAEVMNA